LAVPEDPILSKLVQGPPQQAAVGSPMQKLPGLLRKIGDTSARNGGESDSLPYPPPPPSFTFVFFYPPLSSHLHLFHPPFFCERPTLKQLFGVSVLLSSVLPFFNVYKYTYI
jgi:hypothetical protein